MEIQKIRDSLEKNKATILQSLKNSNHFKDYLFIKDRFGSGQISGEFKGRFDTFYVLNGARGMNDAQKERFFNLLVSRESNIENVLLSLYKIPGYGNRNRLFLSFATKLLHTLNDSLPIYDRNVAYVLGLHNPQYPPTLEDRIKNRISIYEELKTNLSLLLQDAWIQNYLKSMRDELDINSNTVSDEKLLDSLLWTLYLFR
jgi:hypothetical protein